MNSPETQARIRADRENTMNTSTTVVIAGMHRSGTSMVSSLLRKAGVHMGDKLIGAGAGNPRGHFEDEAFVAFHEAILKRFVDNYLVSDLAQIGELTSEEVEKAKALVEARSAEPLWGFKDPRASLFLPFWDSVLPSAKYVLLFRHPLEILLSLLRRGDPPCLRNYFLGLHVWRAYNHAILVFYQSHPGDAVLCDLSAVTANLPGFLGLLRNKLALAVNLDATDSVFHPKEMIQLQIPSEAETLLTELAPHVVEIYAGLQAAADLPALPAQSLHSAPAESPSAWREFLRWARSHAMVRLHPDEVLHLTLAMIDPESLKAATAHLQRYVTQLESDHASDRWWQRYKALSEEHRNLADRHGRQSVYVDILEQANSRLAEMRPRGDSECWAAGRREVSFPFSLALGRLKIRRCEQAQWSDFGPAQGRVSVPNDHELLLYVRESEIPALSALQFLGPTDLHSIYAGGTSFGDEEIQWLAGLTGLRALDLRATQLSGGALHHLYGLKSLRALLLPTQLGNREITALQAALPDCKIRLL